MKLATFLTAGGEIHIGTVETGSQTVYDLTSAAKAADGRVAPAMTTMLALIDAGPAALDQVRTLERCDIKAARMPLKDVRLLAPLEPRQMRDCMAFEQHLLNAYAQAEKRSGVKRKIPEIWYKQPIYYKTNRFAVQGTGADVQWPSYSTWMDFELEFAAVIGKRGRDLTLANALDHVFGYTVFNDFSARDAQLAEMAAQLGPAKGKDFDGGNVLGPWIVTADEVGDPHALAMEVRVNGERWGGGHSRDMHHKWPAILAHISASETLHPGEVIGSGTVGTGCGLELGRKLKDGDVVELEVERIGRIKNRVVAARAPAA
jgi:2-keto-4-pentenoate hydratase/2-oxohepta-3-ene-1,7-dioic acid hydratase in catechol pathway